MPNDSYAIIKPGNVTPETWKNGLGETHDIAIRPKGREPLPGKFDWRLVKHEIFHPCSFPVNPGYESTIILLSNEDGGCLLNHHDKAIPVELDYLSPYRYLSNWPTSCKVQQPQQVLMLYTRDENFKYSVSIETICALDEFNPAENNSRGSQTNTMLMDKYTILYVADGAIKCTIGGESFELQKDSTLVLEKSDLHSPTDLVMIPVKSEDSKTVGDCTVIIIEVSVAPQNLVINSPIMHPSDPIPTGPIRLSGRAGSLILFDDQPGWNIAPPSKLAREVSKKEVTGSGRIIESARHYQPPEMDRGQSEAAVPPPLVKDSLEIADFPVGAISTAFINMVKEGMSNWIRIPVIVARGHQDGPVLGLTAVVHGNELNGVPCIHKVISEIDVSRLVGSVVAVPIVNVPGYLTFCREFSDGKDLNRYFPGTPDGTASQVYNFNFFSKIVKKFDYLIDLHTASFGRINSYYVRADLNDPMSSVFAKLQQPQIILHNSGQDGTLRSAAANIGIKAITVEIGNPQQFQTQFIQWSYGGVMRIMTYLNMFKADLSDLSSLSNLTIVCSKGFWIYTKTGGVLEVYPPVNTIIRKGDLIGRIKNIFGNVVDEIYSPSTGMTIGKSSNPVAMAGDRVLHMGVIRKEHEELAKEAKENY